MRREPPITLRGALQLLGHYERPWIDRLDRLLGGVILAAGAGALMPPLAPLAPIFGWVDQKNEASGLLRRGLDRVRSRVSTVQGYERVELMAAAHTMIVISAVFEVFREGVPPDRRPGAMPTEEEQQMLVAGRWRQPTDDLLTVLYQAEVPLPGGVRGLLENEDEIYRWARLLFQHLRSFLPGLDGGEATAAGLEPVALAKQAVLRYESHFLALASAVPAFAIWAQLSEHAATRATAGRSAAALGRLEEMLTALTAGRPRRDTLSLAHRAVLALPVVRWSPGSGEVNFPTVEDSYVNPRYRLALAGGSTRPADEIWWADQPVHDQIDVLFAGHLTTFDATRRPLLLLGHPGGGKSMLTKILAARLPAEAYTVVRVPLRQVGANAPIHHQIQQALDLATNGRLKDWPQLAEDGRATVRIVLLDGLDELLQATTHDRSGFLQEVVEFQRLEAAQDRPVMVVVTSRTVVAERVDIPPGTPIVKLDEFDDEQVGRWLTVWNRANASAIASDRLRALTAEDALAHPELARQPLLLLMLAIYRSDPDTPADTGELSLSGLYGNLLKSFAAREVNKRAETPLRGEPLQRAVREQLSRLAIAAIGMFNRGRQDITEAELAADLRGLEHGDASEGLGQRVLGEFFFVHAAEARLRPEAGGVRRCYEFLHATFGEYLIASLIVDELAAVADAAFGGSRGPREPGDDLLYALLSHQALASRQPILEFAREMIHALPEADQDRVFHALEALAQRFDRRTEVRRFPRYQPLPESSLRRLAAYSANLVLLRALPAGGVPVTAFTAVYDGPVSRWSSTVNLWRAGLDADGWQAMLDTVDRMNDRVAVNLAGGWRAEFGPLLHARLLGDSQAERQLRIGAALYRRALYYVDGDNWTDAMASWLIPAAVERADDHTGFFLVDPPDGTTEDEEDVVLALVSAAIVRQAQDWSDEFMRLLLEWVIRNFGLDRLDETALAMVIVRKSHLVLSVPSIRDGMIFGTRAATSLLAPGKDPEGDRREIAEAFGAPPDGITLSAPDSYSISVVRADGPVPMGSVTGSLRDGDEWEPGGRLPLILE